MAETKLGQEPYSKGGDLIQAVGVESVVYCWGNNLMVSACLKTRYSSSKVFITFIWPFQVSPEASRREPIGAGRVTKATNG